MAFEALGSGRRLGREFDCPIGCAGDFDQGPGHGRRYPLPLERRKSEVSDLGFPARAAPS